MTDDEFAALCVVSQLRGPTQRAINTFSPDRYQFVCALDGQDWWVSLHTQKFYGVSPSGITYYNNTLEVLWQRCQQPR